MATVEVLDGVKSLGTANTDADGNGYLDLPGLQAGHYDISARVTPADTPASNRWQFEVIDPFVLPMTLSGLLVRDAVRPVIPDRPLGTVETRIATWGVAPYVYTTDAPSVVDVDPATGTVGSVASGVANVYATDSNGSTRFYQVTVSNCFTIHFGSFRLRGHAAAISEAEARGGRLMTQDEMTVYLQSYIDDPGWRRVGWENSEEWVWWSQLAHDGAWKVIRTLSPHRWASLGETGWCCVAAIIPS